MWIKAGSKYFNTDTIAYIQVSMDDHSPEPRTVYLHFTNESHTCTLHGPEAAVVFHAMQVCLTQIDTARPSNDTSRPTAVVAGAV